MSVFSYPIFAKSSTFAADFEIMDKHMAKMKRTFFLGILLAVLAIIPVSAETVKGSVGLQKHTQTDR